MARSVSSIRQYLTDTLVSMAAYIGLTIDPNKWSKSDYKNLILDTVATGQATEEQLWDAYKLDIQSIAKSAPPETNEWLQNQLLNNFQFNSEVPQLVSILPTATQPDFSPKFSVQNDTYKILKYCSIKPGTYGTSLVKVAAQVSGFPADVDTTYGAGTLDAVRAYLKAITNPSITKIVSSGLADRLFLQLDVYFDGQYAPVIQANIIAAINAFLAALPFNGTLIWSDLEQAIKAVAGVTDCVPVTVRARGNSTAFPGGNQLITAYTTVNRLYDSIVGYIILEDNSGNTLADPRISNPSINNLNLIPN